MLNYNADGLVPVCVQDYRTNEVLMLAYMNEESLALTKNTGQMHYYSRSRKTIWHKGETSGHYQDVISIAYDCYGNSLLAKVMQTGVACHTGERSCFYRTLHEVAHGETPEPGMLTNEGILKQIQDVVRERQKNPKEGSYTNYLLAKGADKTLKKVGEECAEVIIAAKNENKNELANETADLLYHLSVLLVQKEMTWEDVFTVLEQRRK